MAFKVASLAKDLGLKSSKQITELMTARGLECSSTQKSLSAKEFDIIFDALTREKQIKNIDDYLFGDTYIPTKVKATKAAPAPEKKAEPAVVETAPVAKVEEKKAAPEVKSAPKTEAAKAPTASKEKVTEKPAEKPAVKEEAPARQVGPRT